MPELTDQQMNDAFDHLTRDMTSLPGSPGARAAIGTARRRRRTTVGAGLAAVAVVAGGIVGSQLGGPDRPDVAGDLGLRPLPSAAVLAPAVLDDATQGWLGPWSTQVDDELDVNYSTCLESLDEADMPEPARSGDAVFGTTGAALLGTVAEFDRTGAASSLNSSAVDQIAECLGSQPTVVQYVGGGSVTYFDTSDEHATLWLGLWEDRLGLVVAATEDDRPATDDAQVGVADALMAAVQDDDSLTGSSATTEQRAEEPITSETMVSYPGVTPDDLEAVAGVWTRTWTPDGQPVSSRDRSACTQALDAAPVGQGNTVGSTGTETYATFRDAATAAQAWDALQSELGACPRAAWQMHEGSAWVGDHTVWATSDTGTLFMVQQGPTIATLQIEGDTDPQLEVADLVNQLLLSSVTAGQTSAGIG